MTYDPRIERIGYDGRRLGWGVRGLVSKLLAFAAAAVLLLGIIAISIVAFTVIVTGVLVVGAYIWWKTRDLRKQMRASSTDGNVIEGEVITRVVRDVESHDRNQR
jgi:hypothetical protein